MDHSDVLSIIRIKYKEKPYKACNITLETDQNLCYMFFKNFRINTQNCSALRLSYEGLLIMQNYFDNWKILFDDSFIIKSKYLLHFDKISRMPWYIDSTKLLLFDQDLALKVKLSGDLETFMENFKI